MMKTPQDKYRNDPAYRHLVDMIEAFVDTAEFTPSELRQAVVLACIHYEMRRSQTRIYNPKVIEALDVLCDFSTGKIGS